MRVEGVDGVSDGDFEVTRELAGEAVSGDRSGLRDWAAAGRMQAEVRRLAARRRSGCMGGPSGWEFNAGEGWLVSGFAGIFRADRGVGNTRG